MKAMMSEERVRELIALLSLLSEAGTVSQKEFLKRYTIHECGFITLQTMELIVHALGIIDRRFDSLENNGDGNSNR